MSAPDKCPRCGADIRIMSEGGSWREFRCHTQASSFNGEPFDIAQSVRCLKAERDALAARVKELEAYAERLEEAGDRFAENSEPSAWLNWESAKETKP